ncbi:MAG: protein-L-isoaspartate(D-aspartate) O-methyltransferase [Gammaproteobacteria bacterium]|nr:protein-L-isoaspartate(D-aspartate) O-methyltransferase [Gammaproteobacteria bacterium]
MKFVNRLFFVVLVIFTVLTYSSVAFSIDYSERRKQLINEINKDILLTYFSTKRQQFDPRVMEVLGKVPRHLFVPKALQESAYKNRPLPIGYGQTISQPYIVALMTDLLETKKDASVLEIGTGSGYQAAVLAELVKSVFTIEIIEPLEKKASSRLKTLGYDNVTVKLADGYYGWEQHAPFDGIIVTAAANHIPPPLVKQLKPGGRMVIPVGGHFFTQNLTLVVKSEDGTVKTYQILPVAFVPFTRGH